MNYIPLNQCKNNHIYYAEKGCFVVALFLNNKFYTSCTECGTNFLNIEQHCDSPIGTIKPLKDLGKTEVIGNREEILSYLNEKTAEMYQKDLKDLPPLNENESILEWLNRIEKDYPEYINQAQDFAYMFLRLERARKYYKRKQHV